MFIVLLAFAPVVFAEDQAALLKEFEGKPPYYVLRTSNVGNEFFVAGPVSCACKKPMKVSVRCSKNLRKDLQAEQAKSKTDSSKPCASAADCRPDKEVIFASCSTAK